MQSTVALKFGQLLHGAIQSVWPGWEYICTIEIKNGAPMDICPVSAASMQYLNEASVWLPSTAISGKYRIRSQQYYVQLCSYGEEADIKALDIMKARPARRIYGTAELHCLCQPRRLRYRCLADSLFICRLPSAVETAGMASVK